MQRACNEGWEGVIAKRLNFRYEHCQSPHPLKMKLRGVAGVGCRRIHGTTGRTDRPGCALVAYFEANELVFAGKVGTGFDSNLLVELRARLDAIEVPKSPFTKAIGLPASSRALGTAGDRGTRRDHRVDAARGNGVVLHACVE